MLEIELIFEGEVRMRLLGYDRLAVETIKSVVSENFSGWPSSYAPGFEIRVRSSP